MSESSTPNQNVTEMLKNTVIVVNDKDGFLNTEKKLFEKGFYWYGLNLLISKVKDGKNGFINFKDNNSHINLYDKYKHNTVIIPFGIIDGIKDFNGMTISTINDLEYLVKERGITKVIHYLDLDKFLNKCV